LGVASKYAAAVPSNTTMIDRAGWPARSREFHPAVRWAFTSAHT
jgi:hypothetical protein